jgi:CBS domain-containing protein
MARQPTRRALDLGRSARHLRFVPSWRTPVRRDGLSLHGKNLDKRARAYHLFSHKETEEMETVAEFLAGKGTAVYTVKPEATVYEALELMADKNIGAVLVTDQSGKLAGIFSERDYARKMMIKGRDSHSTKVKEIMTTLVVSINPETRLRDCMSLMTEKRIRHLPVFQGEKLVGVVSIGDVVKSLLSEQDYVISQQAYKIDQLENYISLSP